MVWYRRHFAVWLAVTLGTAALASCFDGADALGLPCERDEDCGTKHKCEDGSCGGLPDTTGSAEDESSASITATVGSTQTSPTVTASESTGSPAVCGDGVQEGDEECDEAGNTETCDMDCTFVECGDGFHNPATEECDDANQSALDECTPDCYSTLFFDDVANPAVSADKWTLGGTLPGVEWTIDEGEWVSGAYQPNGGTATIEFKMPIELPTEEPPNARLELRFSHRFAFDPDEDCASPPGDGGQIHIEPTGEDPVLVEPEFPNMYTTALRQDDCDVPGQIANPIAGTRAFTRSDSNPMVRVLLQPYLGKEIRVRFVAGYDCGECDPATADNAWAITNVVVAPFRVED